MRASMHVASLRLFAVELGTRPHEDQCGSTHERKICTCLYSPVGHRILYRTLLETRCECGSFGIRIVDSNDGANLGFYLSSSQLEQFIHIYNVPKYIRNLMIVSIITSR